MVKKKKNVIQDVKYNANNVHVQLIRLTVKQERFRL